MYTYRVAFANAANIMVCNGIVCVRVYVCVCVCVCVSLCVWTMCVQGVHVLICGCIWLAYLWTVATPSYI